VAGTRNVEGLIAQRRALVGWLEDLPAEAWTEEVRGVVAGVVDEYADALTGTLDSAQRATSHGPVGDPAGLVAELVRLANQLEASFAEEADARWDDWSRSEFREAGGTTGMGITGLLLVLHRAAHTLGRLTGRPVPVPPESQEAAVAALSWLAGDKVEAPVRVVIEGGPDFVIGSGPVTGTLRTDHDALIGVAAGEADAGGLASEGRWSFDGPDDAARALAHSLAAAFSGEVITRAGDTD
jgi:hypothetical protein